jgi:hypothetical protein
MGLFHGALIKQARSTTEPQVARCGRVDKSWRRSKIVGGQGLGCSRALQGAKKQNVWRTEGF